MGNSAGKEQRSPPPYGRHAGSERSGSYSQASPTSPNGPYSPDGPQVIYTSRHGRGSRSELSTLFGIGNHDREQPVQEVRRETKAEREARKLERERVNRERERERSMRDEHVDGGYLVTQGVYTGIEDYNKPIVRQLMIERRIAPFWRGLNDHSDSWTEHQLVAAARGLPIPAPDEVPESPVKPATPQDTSQLTENDSNKLSVPIPGRSSANTPELSPGLPPPHQQFSLPTSVSPSSGSALLRGRAKTLASLTTGSKNASQSDLQPREVQLPHDPLVNGQPIEAYLYKDASECPICFLYYPPYLNRTRCCDQPICSECFVQIKRPDPHPPEHADPSAPPASAEEAGQDPEGMLVSEPAACPYCVQPEFGVTFDPLPLRRGLAYANQAQGSGVDRSAQVMSSSNSSLASLPNSGQLSPQPPRRKRGISLSVQAPEVISTDQIRPDWATKLASARAHAARRSAAATALHTAAYLMGGRNGSPGERSFSGFGRHRILRRGTGSDSPSSGNSSAHLNMLAMMSERYGPRDSQEDGSQPREQDPNAALIAGPPRQSSRRNRVEDLEEMMMMEAIRLSLASEDDRRKREEKDAKKEAKKKQKEEKKAEKAARKTGMYTSSANQSSGTLGSPSSASLNFDANSSKGKGIIRDEQASPTDAGPSRLSPHDSQNESAQSYLERSRANLSFSEPAQSAYKPSHLRNLSNVSSSASSIVDPALDGAHAESSFDNSPNASGIMIPRADNQEAGMSATPPGGGAGMEPMFNFSSLSAMVRSEEKGSGDNMVEHTENAVPQLDGAHEVPAAAEGTMHEDTSLAREEGNVNAETSGMEQSVATIKPESPNAGSNVHDDPEIEAIPAQADSISESQQPSDSVSKVQELAMDGNGERREVGSV